MTSYSVGYGSLDIVTKINEVVCCWIEGGQLFISILFKIEY